MGRKLRTDQVLDLAASLATVGLPEEGDDFDDAESIFGEGSFKGLDAYDPPQQRDKRGSDSAGRVDMTSTQKPAGLQFVSRQTVAGELGIGMTTLHRLMKEDKNFPKTIKLGSRTFFERGEVENYKRRLLELA